MLEIRTEEVYTKVTYLRTFPKTVRDEVGDNDPIFLLSRMMSACLIYRVLTNKAMFAEYRPTMGRPEKE